MPAEFAAWVAELTCGGSEPVIAGLAVGRTSWQLTDDRPVAQLVTPVSDPAHRGTGVGSVLVSCCEDWARQRGADRLLITSGLQRTEAHEWYLHRGFERTGVRLAKALLSR